MFRFVTEYHKDDGCLYGGEVDALDFEHAQSICDARGKGETVSGQLYAVVSAEHWTADDATRFAQALADDNPDPPLASEFDS